MMRRILILSVAGLLAACGTAAVPVYRITPTALEAVEAVAAEAVAQLPTNTPTLVPPTATPIPATATPLPATPTLEPTVAAPAADASANDPKKFLVDLANPTNGETLFNQTIDAVGFACATCHNVQGNEVKIGPSLAGLSLRAGNEVAGEGAYTYVYNSIYNSQAHVVSGFENAVKMPIYGDVQPPVLTDAQIYDLTAYVLSLPE